MDWINMDFGAPMPRRSTSYATISVAVTRRNAHSTRSLASWYMDSVSFRGGGKIVSLN